MNGHSTTGKILVNWSERVLLDGDLAERDAETLAAVAARLGVADVRAFGLTWDDCQPAFFILSNVERLLRSAVISKMRA